MNRLGNETRRFEESEMKIKTLIVTVLFAISMWAQNAAPTAEGQGKAPAAAACCKDGAACCKDGAACCNGKDAASCCKDGANCCKAGTSCCGGDMAKSECCKEGSECCKAGSSCCGKMAKANKAKGCCGGKMCDRHKGEKA